MYKLITIFILVAVTLAPVVIATIVAVDNSVDLITSFEETEEEQNNNEDKDSEEEFSIEYFFFIDYSSKTSSLLSFTHLFKSDKILIRNLEIFLPPPKKL